MKKIYLLFLFVSIIQLISKAQCVTTINTFPYNENFELSTGNWVSGGVANDWAWGSPSKNFIVNAGSGNNCWVTGGLLGSTYNFSERSYIVSPCFDFTNLQYPHIKFKIYWECENQYDGAVLQYTLNNGTTWTNVGSNTDPVDCLNQNWYNQSNITALNTLATPKNGWAGTVLPTSGGCFGGNGSGGWVVAQHCMSYLAGQPNVQFRFAFGAGTICNNFDGFGIDDITIENAPANSANFAYSCTTNALEYQFANTSALCPTNFTWDFGDVASGVNNTSTLANPLHTFSLPGTYSVTLSVSGPCNAPSTITQTIVTIDNMLTATNLSCSYSANGSIVSSTSNAVSPISYNLQPNNSTNSFGSFGLLIAGTYTVNVTDGNGCYFTSTATITAPSPILLNVNSTNITCNGFNNGTISASASGGTGIITYTLNPGSLTSGSGNFSNLSPNTYTLTATDGNGCYLDSIITLIQPSILTINQPVTIQNIACHGDNSGSVSVTTSGGNSGILNYILLPNNLTNTTGNFNNLSSGTYTIGVADVKNCTSSIVVNITEPPLLIITSLIVTNPGCNPSNDGKIIVNANGGNGTLQYSFGSGFSTNNQFTSLTANTYTITVKDANNCTATSTAILLNGNAPSISLISSSNPSCYNSMNGSINVLANGTTVISNYIIAPGGVSNTTGNFTNLTGGIYTINATDANQCSKTIIVTLISPNELIITDLLALNDSCGSGNNGKLVCSVTGGTSPLKYIVNPNNLSNFSGVFNNLLAGNYTVTVVDKNECNVSTTGEIKENICCDNVFVPNAFSPNNDGKNDELKLLNKLGIELDEFIIVNRWGNIAFKARHIDDSWDGKIKGVDAEIGTYYYLLKYKCLNTSKNFLYKGDILLIR